MSLYSFGSNGSGQLGLGHTDDTESPSLVLLPDNGPDTTIDLSDSTPQLAFGGNHTLLLDTKTGRVYSTGDNSAGQLGLGPDTQQQQQVSLFTAIPGFSEPIAFVAAGWQFSVAVGRSGSVYTAGEGRKGELCQSTSSVTSHATFQKVHEFTMAQDVVAVSAGLAHVCVVLADGSVWGWGASRKAQLGAQWASQALVDGSAGPVQVEWDDMFPAKTVVCGRAFTAVLGDAGEVKVLSTDKAMAVVGSAVEKAMLGLGTDKVVQISAGWSTLHLLLASGRLLSFGNNSHGQLGPAGSSNEAQKLRLARHSSGTEHSLAVLASDDSPGRVVAWGWGEHGNCGAMYRDSTQASGDNHSAEISQVYEVHRTGNGQPVRGIWGGYASSWILE